MQYVRSRLVYLWIIMLVAFELVGAYTAASCLLTTRCESEWELEANIRRRVSGSQYTFRLMPGQLPSHRNNSRNTVTAQSEHSELWHVPLGLMRSPNQKPSRMTALGGKWTYTFPLAERAARASR